jgi:hypothetical protein
LYGVFVRPGEDHVLDGDRQVEALLEDQPQVLADHAARDAGAHDDVHRVGCDLFGDVDELPQEFTHLPKAAVLVELVLAGVGDVFIRDFQGLLDGEQPAVQVVLLFGCDASAGVDVFGVAPAVVLDDGEEVVAGAGVPEDQLVGRGVGDVQGNCAQLVHGRFVPQHFVVVVEGYAGVHDGLLYYTLKVLTQSAQRRSFFLTQRRRVRREELFSLFLMQRRRVRREDLFISESVSLRWSASD